MSYELNLKMAVEVMRRLPRVGCADDDEYPQAETNGEVIHFYDSLDHHINGGTIWNPSGDIRQAMELIEKMRQRNFLMSIHSTMTMNACDYRIAISVPGEMPQNFNCSLADLPRTICKAIETALTCAVITAALDAKKGKT